MDFYCANCQTTTALDPTTTVETKMKQKAYKANCPTCNKEVVVYGGTIAVPTNNLPIEIGQTK